MTTCSTSRESKGKTSIVVSETATMIANPTSSGSNLVKEPAKPPSQCAGCFSHFGNRRMTPNVRTLVFKLTG